MPRIFACGGGSIGHLAPIVAVCQAICSRDPTAHVTIACAEQDHEQTFLRRYGFPPIPLPSPHSPLGFLRAIKKSFTLLRDRTPNVVFGKGGAVSLPICLAARWKGIPIVIHESDAVMGRTNRFLSRIANVVCLGFPEAVSGERFAMSNNTARYIVTGNPVRPEMARGSREEGLRITQFSGKRPILLIIGGSQGAQAINEIIAALLPELTKFCDIIHITGPGKMPHATCHMPHAKAYWSIEYVHDELPHLYAITTIALSRAGAGVLSELAANGIPSIVVPLRGLAQDHQWHNAQCFARQHACILLEQECLTNLLIATIQRMIDHPTMCTELRKRILSFYVPDAARHIAEIILKNIA